MQILVRFIAVFTCFHLFLLGVNAQKQPAPHPSKKRASTAAATKVNEGVASFYGAKFQGKKMANGEKFDANRLTAASNSLPLGTFVKVSNLRNRKTVIVKITDRMHHKNKRLIDVSKEAARQLGFVGRGLTKVRTEVVSKEDALKN